MRRQFVWIAHAPLHVALDAEHDSVDDHQAVHGRHDTLVEAESLEKKQNIILFKRVQTTTLGPCIDQIPGNEKIMIKKWVEMLMYQIGIEVDTCTILFSV